MVQDGKVRFFRFYLLRLPVALCPDSIPYLLWELLRIGYDAMLTESFVAIMALVTASIIEPGLYFAMNTPRA